MRLSHVEIDAFENNLIEEKVYNSPVRIIIDPTSTFGSKAKVSALKNNLLSFSKCTFNSEVSITTSDKAFGSPQISFRGCYIDSFSTGLIIQPVNISFFSCYNKHFTSAQKPQINLDIRNSLGTYFIENIKKLNVSFTAENIFPELWKNIFKIEKNIFKIKTSFYVASSREVRFFSNLFNIDNSTKRGLIRRREEMVSNYKISYIPSEKELELLDINISLNFKASLAYDTAVIKHLRLNSLTLKGKPSEIVKIEESKINEIFLHNFSPQNEFKLYQIEPLNREGKFEIHESSLENTWFDNVQLDQYKLVSFFKSSLSNIKFTSTTFPKTSTNFKSFQSLENIHYPDQKKDFYYKDQYEIFLQLRMALLKTGNTYEAQKMKSISYNALNNVSDVSRLDKTILFLNKLTNRHGISPFRAFFLLIPISIFIYLLYLNSLGLLFGESINWNLVANYFSFLDITHKSNFMVSKDLLHPFSIVLDFTNKIVLGYLIYQFISGFRKFGK
jgi:hypothetical protein